MKGLRLPDGRERVVQHVKIRDRGADGERGRFTSAILPRWARQTRSLDAVLPILYLRGVSTGDFQAALGVLLGGDAPNLSPLGDRAAEGRVGGRLRALAAA
jgi:putative transposase